MFTAERLRWAGMGSAALGAAAWAGGGYALATALAAKKESNADCDASGCGPLGLEKRSEAVTRGNWATALGVGGAVLIGAGVTLFYFGERASAPKHAQLAPRLLVAGGPSRWVASITGSW